MRIALRSGYGNYICVGDVKRKLITSQTTLCMSDNANIIISRNNEAYYREIRFKFVYFTTINKME